MPRRPDERFTAALFRVLAAPQRAAAAGVFAIERSRLRLVAANSELASLGSAGRSYWPLPQDWTSPGTPQRIAPKDFGLDAAFAAIAPIFTTDAIPAGFLLVANRTARHLTPH